jgi:hypothetical protein
MNKDGFDKGRRAHHSDVKQRGFCGPRRATW